MKLFIELHDSTVGAIERRDGAVVVHFLPAYLHKHECIQGIERRTGWLQEATLVFTGATISGDLPEFPCDISDGELIAGEDRHDNMLPAPLEITAPAGLRLVFVSGRKATVTGGSVRLELLGEPKYLEDLTW